MKLINVSNHPSNRWDENQKGEWEVIDLPFPSVDPSGSTEYIINLANETVGKVKTTASPKEAVVHCMGEMTLTYAIVSLLQKEGYTVVASTTERVVEERDGVKTSVFKFVQFREYPKL